MRSAREGAKPPKLTPSAAGNYTELYVGPGACFGSNRLGPGNEDKGIESTQKAKGRREFTPA